MSDPSCTDPSIPSSSTDPEITESVLTVPPSDASLTNHSVANDQVQGTELSTEIDANTVDDASLQDKIPAPMHSDLQLLSNGDQDQTDAKEDDSSSQSSSDEESSICQSEMVLSDYEEEKEEKVLKTKNEIPELPPIEPINVEIPIEEPLICVGRVDQIIQDNLVIIAADNSGDYQVLDTDSVLLTKDKKPIGKIFEVFGRVQQPLYSIRISGKEEINELGLEINTPVYYIQNLVQMVFTQPLKAQKGSDASNLHDEEVGDNEAEFSDDEKEAEHKRQMKKRKSPNKDNERQRQSPYKDNDRQRHNAPNQNVNRNIQGYNYQHQQFQQQSAPNSYDQYTQYYYQMMQASFNQQNQQFYNYQANPYPYGYPQGLYNPAFGMGSGSYLQQNSNSITNQNIANQHTANQHIANQARNQEHEEGEISLYDNIFQQ